MCQVFILDTCHYEFKYLYVCSVVGNFMQHLKFCYEDDTKLICIVQIPQMNKIQMYMDKCLNFVSLSF